MDGVVAERENLDGKPAPDTFLDGAAHARRRAQRRPPCSRTRRPASRRGARGTSAGSSASTAPVRPRRSSGAGPTSSSQDLDELIKPAMIGQEVFAVEPWLVRERELRDELLAETESIFALSNGHIGLRGNLDEGEPAGAPGHVPQRLLRGAAAALRRGRLRLPRGGPDDDQRHQRQADPAARRRRAVRRPLRAAGAPRARARPARRRAAPRGGVGLARRPGRAHPLDAARVLRPALDRRHPLRGRAAGGARARIVVQSELVANEPVPGRVRRPAGGRRRCARRWSASTTATTSCAPALIHRTKASGLRMAAGMDHIVDGHRGDGHARPRASPTSRGSRSAPSCEPGQSLRVVKLLAYGWSSQRSLPVAARPGRGRARRGASARAGTGCAARSASTSTTSGTGADVELDGDPALQQAVRFALFHVAAGRRAGRAAGDPGQGADRQRLRRPLVLGHGDLHAPGAHLHRTRRRRATP